MPRCLAIRPGRHPFPFLLYIEWAMLGVAIAIELSPTLLPRINASPGLSLALLLGFAGLGCWLPITPLAVKTTHILSQFGLIAMISQFGGAKLRLFPLLYIVLVIRACLMLGWRGRLMVTGAVLMAFMVSLQLRLQLLNLPLPAARGQPLLPLVMGLRLNLLLLFVMLLVFVLLLMNALIAERERREELHQANEKLRASAAQIEKLAMAQERSRIARDIHDALGHTLTGLNIQLEGALKLWDGQPEQARDFVAQAKVMGSSALQEVRQSVAALRDIRPYNQTLETAVSQLISQFQQMTGTQPEVIFHCPPLPLTLEVTVYRILQEALTNACKHAQATRLSITVKPAQQPAQLHLSIQDNGQGFELTRNTTGFGLSGMQERVEAEGGRFDITSRLGVGTCIQVWLPLPPEKL